MTNKYNFGAFETITAELISSSGQKFDLKKPENSIMSITIFEDIQSHAVTGDIIIRDISNFASIGPLIGQEFLKLKLKTNTLEDEDSFDFVEFPFVVNSLQSKTQIGNNIEVLVLTFSTDSLSKNNRTKITRTLEGTYSDIVKKMFDDMATGKKCFVEPTVGVKKITSPNIRPADIIRIAMAESISKFLDGTISNYVFFETLKAFHFRSLPSLYAQPYKQNYTKFAPGSMPRKTTKDNLDERELSRIIEFNIGSGNDTLIHYLSGTFASNLYVHNIFNKSISKNTYNYFENFRNEKHIGNYHGKGKPNPPFSTKKIESKKTVSDFPARTFVVPISQNGVNDAHHSTPSDTKVISPHNPQDYLQQRVSQMNQLENGISIVIETHGNTVISAGDIVKADIPYTGLKTDEDKDDPVYKGEFLVKRVRHDFDYVLRSHRTNYVLVKDSVEQLFPDDGEEIIFTAKNEFIEDQDTFYPRNSNL